MANRHKTIWRLATVRGSLTAIRGAGEIHADGSASGRIEIDRAGFDMTWNQLGMVKGNAAVSVVARFTRPVQSGQS